MVDLVAEHNAGNGLKVKTGVVYKSLLRISLIPAELSLGPVDTRCHFLRFDLYHHLGILPVCRGNICTISYLQSNIYI